MQLILTHYTLENQLKVLGTQPSLEINEGIRKILEQVILENIKSRGFEEIISAEHGNFVNYIFTIPSKLNPFEKEILMITGMLDEHENPKIFIDIFNDFIKKVQETPDLYVALTQAGPGADAMKRKIADQLYTFYTNLAKKIDGLIQGMGSVVFLGISAVGKTSIINRLIRGDFNPNTRPTLSPQFLRMIYEKIDFRVFDMAGQTRLRKQWKTAVSKPNAVVFVIDSSANIEHHKEASKEFQDMMTFYFHEDTPNKLHEDTPVLILANKIDLNPNFTQDQIDALYIPASLVKNYHIGFCSALTGEGIEESFKWLVKGFKLSSSFKN